RLWDDLRASYWFIPALMTLSAIAVSQAVLAADGALYDADIGVAEWLYGAG
ncbi:MAG: DUF2254 domain-containing protein, partial [Actinobacteria bacterium]|nr:DUF2254 domain-containing protein [Actinomycetota bacterium]NIW32796.1 DUF2254 domain-containing protein [Actinomycetota bacterium]NIX20491.1 DUF2254 domain-containing protein [Actinomycetota bacterium]